MEDWLYYINIFITLIFPALLLLGGVFIYKGLKSLSAGDDILKDIEVEQALTKVFKDEFAQTRVIITKSIEDEFAQGFARYETFVKELTQEQRMAFFDLLDKKIKALKKELLENSDKDDT